MNILKQLTVLGLLSIFFNCHNNAHLRTQKILKKEESVISASTVLPMGGRGDDWDLQDNGIIGFRGELSYLRGFGDYELGPYLGFGVSDFDDPDDLGFIIGFDYRKYMNIDSNNPRKIGAQAEINFSEQGSVLHFKPSITTVTSKENPFYLGGHGIFYNGNLGYDSYRFGDVDYSYSSLGIGVTAGAEYIFSKSSLQFQIDMSLVNNTFNNINRSYESDNWYYYNQYPYDSEIADPGDNIYYLLGLSAGMSFFNAPKISNESFEPMPAPSYQKESSGSLAFDPNTGEPLDGLSNQFDPETGEMILSQSVKFDPNTGEKINLTVANNNLKDPLIQLEGSIKTMNDDQVKKRAYSDATNYYVSPLWSLAGAASIPVGFFGAFVGGTIGFEILELDAEGFLFFFGGGGLGLASPYLLARNIEPLINYPSELINIKQKSIYRKNYISKIKERRYSKISVTQGSCIVIPSAAILLLILSSI